MKGLHQDLDVFRNTLFNVGKTSLDKWVGKKVAFRNPRLPCEHDIFEIVCVQKIHNGELRLRGISTTNDPYKWGMPIDPKKVRILKINE